MSLTKQMLVDQITIDENSNILVREATSILEDGIEISKTYNRKSLSPNQDLSNEADNIKAIANIVWTPTVIAEYNAKIAEQTTLLTGAK